MEINANVLALDVTISGLKSLKGQCEAVDVSPVEVSGSGVTNVQLQALDAQYTQLKQAMLTLLDHTEQFMTNVRDSMIGTDKTLAAAFTNGGAEE